MNLINRKKQIVELAEKGGRHYLGAIVLGLNDALVELTGALAGFTVSLENNRLIALAGFTTGVAATLSMAASEFLSKKAESSTHPCLASLITGIAYLVTVVILLIPFFIFPSPLFSLMICLFFGALVILVYTCVASKIRGTNFLHDFVQMILISFSVAAIAYFLGWIVKAMWNIGI